MAGFITPPEVISPRLRLRRPTRAPLLDYLEAKFRELYDL